MIRLRSVLFEATSELIKLREQLGEKKYLDHIWHLREPHKPFTYWKWPYKRREHESAVVIPLRRE